MTGRIQLCKGSRRKSPLGRGNSSLKDTEIGMNLVTGQVAWPLHKGSGEVGGALGGEGAGHS